jgi:hypothetical protein
VQYRHQGNYKLCTANPELFTLNPIPRALYDCVLKIPRRASNAGWQTHSIQQWAKKDHIRSEVWELNDKEYGLDTDLRACRYTTDGAGNLDDEIRKYEAQREALISDNGTIDGLDEVNPLCYTLGPRP